MDEIEEAASVACASLLPEKSKKRYQITYDLFRKWCDGKKVTHTEESVFLAYFLEKSKQYSSPSSLWCEYSMLRSTVSLNDNVDISKYSKLKAFLKNKNIGYRPKKSEIFTIEEIDKFLTEAPNEVYLMKKVVAIMGIAGACRKDELCKITLSDITDKGNFVLVKIPDSKNHQQRSFSIVDNEKFRCLELFRKYLSLRPKHTENRRFFLRFYNGKCVNQPVGRNIFAKIPSEIAKYLNLPNAEKYTGHSFRRTSATLLANSGANILQLKRAGGWKSSTVAESYVAESVTNKIEVANKIFHINEGEGSSFLRINNKRDDSTSSYDPEWASTSLVNKETRLQKDIPQEIHKSLTSMFNVNTMINCQFHINLNKNDA